jgi:hypothetical protein
MRFYDEGVATSNNDRQSVGPNSCSPPEPMASPEPVDADTDTDDDTLVFDMDNDLAADIQSRARRSASPPRSSPIAPNIVASNVSMADSLASSVPPSLRAFPASIMSSSPTGVETSTSNIALLNDGPTASATDIICQPLCNNSLRPSNEYQPRFPLFQPAGEYRLWYLGFLGQ